jgi:hypothetical protein
VADGASVALHTIQTLRDDFGLIVWLSFTIFFEWTVDAPGS